MVLEKRGNAEKILEMNLPKLTEFHFKLCTKTHVSSWFQIRLCDKTATKSNMIGWSFGKFLYKMLFKYAVQG